MNKFTYNALEIIQGKKYTYAMISSLLLLLTLSFNVFFQSVTANSAQILSNYNVQNSIGSTENPMLTIDSTEDPSKPTGSIISPAKGSSIYAYEINLRAEAVDIGSGINRVDFYAKSYDIWQSDILIHLGTDTSSPYEYVWDVTDLEGQVSVTLVIEVFDNAGNTSGYIDETNFLIKNTEPLAPSLNSPNTAADFMSGVPIAFLWNETEGAEQYYLEITGGALQYPILSPGWIAAKSHTYTNMLDMSSQPYNWRVKARNDFGESNWSETRTLNVTQRIPPPSAPSLVSPSNNTSFIQGTPITFSWNSASFAEQHLLEIKLGIDTVMSSGWMTETTYLHSNILSVSSEPYTWNVRSRNAAGVSSLQTRSFYILPIPTGCGVPSHNGVLMYTEINCSGSRYIANSSEFTKLTSPFNNTIKSIYIKDGWSIKIFENKDKTGGRLCITSSQNTLKGLTYNNGNKVVLNGISTISAFKTYQSSNCQ